MTRWHTPAYRLTAQSDETTISPSFIPAVNHRHDLGGDWQGQDTNLCILADHGLVLDVSFIILLPAYCKQKGVAANHTTYAPNNGVFDNDQDQGSKDLGNSINDQRKISNS